MDGPIPLQNGVVGAYSASIPPSRGSMPSPVPYGFGYPPMPLMYAGAHGAAPGSPASMGYGAPRNSATSDGMHKHIKHGPSRSASTTDASAPSSSAGAKRTMQWGCTKGWLLTPVTPGVTRSTLRMHDAQVPLQTLGDAALGRMFPWVGMQTATRRVTEKNPLHVRFSSRLGPVHMATSANSPTPLTKCPSSTLTAWGYP